jgi:forkhead box protein K
MRVLESDIEDVQPEIKPEVMPPKPKDTYSQLTYRAIKAMGGKANLGEILQWIMDNYDWYRYNQGDKWVVSLFSCFLSLIR